MIKGIDLSTWNENVNYEELKNNGIEFAIIRSGYGKDNNQKDDMFETHYAGCKAAGIKVGAYLYSYCTDVNNAKLEAQNCLNQINGKDFDLPIFIDLEEQRTSDLGIDQVTQIALIFCRIMRDNGYNSGVYANLNWFRNYIRPEALKLEGFAIWLAQWNDELTANFDVDIWQFTDELEISNFNGDGNYLINENLINNDNPEPVIDVNIYQSIAVDVVFGKYGNGEQRKQALGEYYEETQNIVNELYEIIGG